MSQKQIIDFTASRLRATADFSLRRFEGSAYENEQKGWLIKAQGYMRFNLNLASRRGVNLIFKISPAGASCRADLIINGKTYVEKWNLSDDKSCESDCRAWHVPQLMLQAGDNDIVLRLHDEALLRLAGVHMFFQQDQQHEFWCWSAVATSISKYYDPISNLTQCMLANSIFERDDCCHEDKGGSTNSCNKMCKMQTALEKTGNFDRTERGAPDVSIIAGEANEGKPIAAVFSFYGSGHVLTVTGFGVDDMVAVYDPWYGPSYIKYEEFKTNYMFAGRWHSSYFTRERNKS